MRNYEIALVVRPDIDDEAVAGLLDKLKGWVSGAGGSTGDVERWGKRRLAYPIRKQQEGQYLFVPATMPPTAAAEVERNLRLNEQLLRYMLTVAV